MTKSQRDIAETYRELERAVDNGEISEREYAEYRRRIDEWVIDCGGRFGDDKPNGQWS